MYLNQPIRTFLSARDPDRDRMATFGLVVRGGEETAETEFRHFIPVTDTIIHHTRVATDDTGVMDMAHLAPALHLLPAARFDAIGVVCLQTAAMIGARAITEAVRAVFPDALNVTDPLSAIRAYLAHHGMTRIGLLTADSAPAAMLVGTVLSDAGFTTTSAGTFLQDDPHDTARIAAADVLFAIEGLAESGDCDVIVIASTDLPSAALLTLAARKTGLPVISANSALAWHMTVLSETEPVR